MGSRHLVVFDMDGVLIDVSGSYRDTVRQAARLFLKGAAGWEALPDPLFSLAELARLKQAGGLNNDWDLTCRALTLLFAKVRKGRLSRARDLWTRFEESIRRCDVSELTTQLRAEQAPLTSLRVFAPIPEDPFVAAFFRGDVGSGNIIKQIFQEVYLGRRLFQKTYGLATRRHQGRGLIEREKPIVRPADLQSLAERHILAIATGRPACEADYPLQAFGLAPYFPTLMTLDDCIREEQRRAAQSGEKVSLSKPHPFMLDAAAARHPGAFGRCFYVGDMPDDMQAAARSAAGFVGVGFLGSAPEKEGLAARLRAAGGRHLIESLGELAAVIRAECSRGG